MTSLKNIETSQAKRLKDCFLPCHNARKRIVYLLQKKIVKHFSLTLNE